MFEANYRRFVVVVSGESGKRKNIAESETTRELTNKSTFDLKNLRSVYKGKLITQSCPLFETLLVLADWLKEISGRLLKPVKDTRRKLV